MVVFSAGGRAEARQLPGPPVRRRDSDRFFEPAGRCPVVDAGAWAWRRPVFRKAGHKGLFHGSPQRRTVGSWLVLHGGGPPISTPLYDAVPAVRSTTIDARLERTTEETDGSMHCRIREEGRERERERL